MKTLAIFAGLAISASAHAGILTHTFDISGLASEGSFGGNFPTLTHDFGVGGTIISVSFEVNATMTAPSWSEELQIAIDTPEDTSFDADIDMSTWGGLNNSDPFAGSGSFPANSMSAAGLVYLTLYESFNDGTPNPDAVYGQGSTVTIEYAMIPAPGAAALLGLGGMVTLRRRR